MIPLFYLSESSDAQALPAFSSDITELCKAKGETPERIIRRGEIERSYGHRLFSGARNPSRDTVLQLAFGFELSADEAQQFLKIARVTMLHPKVKRDAVIAYCLHNGMSIMDAQQLLHDNDLPLIGGARNE